MLTPTPPQTCHGVGVFEVMEFHPFRVSPWRIYEQTRKLPLSPSCVSYFRNILISFQRQPDAFFVYFLSCRHNFLYPCVCFIASAVCLFLVFLCFRLCVCWFFVLFQCHCFSISGGFFRCFEALFGRAFCSESLTKNNRILSSYSFCFCFSLSLIVSDPIPPPLPTPSLCFTLTQVTVHSII